MARWQFASWVARFVSYWALLDAFHIGGSVRNALLVLAVQVVASVFPFTPGGAGVQQALLLTIFANNPYVASFSVGQQIATAVLTTGAGFRGAGVHLPVQELPRGDRARQGTSPPREHGGRVESGRDLTRSPDADLLPPQPPGPELPDLLAGAERRAAPDRLAQRPQGQSAALREHRVSGSLADASARSRLDPARPQA